MDLDILTIVGIIAKATNAGILIAGLPISMVFFLYDTIKCYWGKNSSFKKVFDYHYDILKYLSSIFLISFVIYFAATGNAELDYLYNLFGCR